VSWKVGDAIDGRWQVQRIAGGGFGTVYLVYDPQLQQAFAAKTVHEELLCDEIYERFQQETYTWLQLGRHRHVVQAHFLTEVDNRPLLFLEYVEGGDLSEWIGSPRLLEDHCWCLQLALDFCAGMEHAYAHGVQAHRDVKPANCLLTEDGRLKVSDFGLVRVLEGNLKARQVHERLWREQLAASGAEPGPELADTASGVGSITHMAPEQARGEPVDGRADIYAFGVTLYQMLTGKLPFRGHSALSLLYQHAHTPPPPLQLDWAPDLSQDLAVLVAACLEKAPERRPPSFAVLAHVLRDIHRRVAGEEPLPPLEAGEGDGFELSCRGVSLVNLGLPAEGLELLEQAVRVDPQLHAAWANRALALQKLGRYQEAVTSCQVALQIEDSSAAQHLMANALSRAGAHREAELAFRKSLNMDPRNVRAWIDQGLFFGGLNLSGPALESFQNAIRLAPGQPVAWTGRAMVCLNLGDHQEAMACFARSLELNPRQPRVLAHVGDVYLAAEALDNAEMCFGRALELDETLADAWLGMGWDGCWSSSASTSGPSRSWGRPCSWIAPCSWPGMSSGRRCSCWDGSTTRLRPWGRPSGSSRRMARPGIIWAPWSPSGATWNGPASASGRPPSSATRARRRTTAP